jgi:hypothetical protein
MREVIIYFLITGVFKAESVYKGSSLRLSGRINYEGEDCAAHFYL